MLLIERGRQHIDEADRQIKAFFNAKPYTGVVDIDHQTGQEVHKMKLTARLPGGIKTIVKDATANLRDALDHAVYSSAVALVGGDPSDTGFPFAKDAAGVAGELGGKRLRGNPAEIRPFLAAFEPHEAGNKLLWGLNRIRNPNTHRVIVPVGAASIASRIAMTGGEIKGPASIGYSKWIAAENAVEFMRVGIGSEVQYQVDVAMNVTFGNIDSMRDQEVIGTLNAIATEVERVVTDIKAETARLLSERGT